MLLGVLVGLVVGKFVGIAGGGALVVRAGAARLPTGATRSQLAGVAAAGGIGFTVSLFIAGLAFDDGSREQGDAGVRHAARVGRRRASPPPRPCSWRTYGGPSAPA